MEKGQQVIIVKGSGYFVDDHWLNLTPVTPNGKTARVTHEYREGDKWIFRGMKNNQEVSCEACQDGREAMDKAVQFIMGDGGLKKYFWNAVMSDGFITVR